MSNQENYGNEIRFIAGVIGFPEIFPEFIEQIKPSYFYNEQNKKIYECLVNMQNKGIPIDLDILQEKLQEKAIDLSLEHYEAIQDIMYTSSANAKYYAQKIEQFGIQRIVYSKLEGFLDHRDKKDTPSNILDKIESLSLDISLAIENRETKKIGSILQEIHEKIQNQKIDHRSIFLNLPEVDDILLGYKPKQLIIYAGRPSMGKTAYCLDNIKRIAEQGKKVLFFSLEMDAEQVVKNLACSEALLNTRQLQRGQLSDDEYERFTRASGRISNLEIYIDDRPAQTISQIKNRSRIEKKKKNIDIIFIDYLQLIKGAENLRHLDKVAEISHISNSLKILARELDIPVVSVAQLNRATDSRSDHRPFMSDLKGSGAIEQDADVIKLLYRDEYYNKNISDKNIIEVIIAKNRIGMIGTAKLYFQKEYQLFKSFNANYEF